MRCSDCNKFASFELSDDAEQQSLEVSDDGQITAEYRVTLNCVRRTQDDKDSSGARAELSLDFLGPTRLSIHTATPGETHTRCLSRQP
jgi:hypothetical protein